MKQLIESTHEILTAYFTEGKYTEDQIIAMLESGAIDADYAEAFFENYMAESGAQEFTVNNNVNFVKSGDDTKACNDTPAYTADSMSGLLQGSKPVADGVPMGEEGRKMAKQALNDWIFKSSKMDKDTKTIKSQQDAEVIKNSEYSQLVNNGKL